MNDHETRIKALEQARRELEDALIVTAHLATRQSNLLREQAEYLATHEQRIQKQEEHGRTLDERIDKLVSAIGEWIRRHDHNGNS
jgi:formate dehydrogenase maturation protein FdhE